MWNWIIRYGSDFSRELMCLRFAAEVAPELQIMCWSIESGWVDQGYHLTSVPAICSSSFTIDQLSSSGNMEIPA